MRNEIRGGRSVSLVILFCSILLLSGCGGDEQETQEQVSSYVYVAKQLATSYSNMEAAKAAGVLAEMKEDLDLVCDILENMSEKQAAAIIQEMDSEYAAQITKKISAVD